MLLFLQLTTLLGLYLIESSGIATRLAQDTVGQHQIQTFLENELNRQAKKNLQAWQDCMFSHLSMMELKKQPIEWWQSHACVNEDAHAGVYYYYLVESLGTDSCAYINILPHNAVDYYRIVLMARRQFVFERIMIASTWAAVSFSSLSCETVTHEVFSGRQSWVIV